METVYIRGNSSFFWGGGGGRGVNLYKLNKIYDFRSDDFQQPFKVLLMLKVNNASFIRNFQIYLDFKDSTKDLEDIWFFQCKIDFYFTK